MHIVRFLYIHYYTFMDSVSSAKDSAQIILVYEDVHQRMLKQHGGQLTIWRIYVDSLSIWARRSDGNFAVGLEKRRKSIVQHI